jgi:SAM-dependent methyltransferase
MTTNAPAATTPVTGSPTADPNPAAIMQLASGFMAAKHLFAANELGLFEALADAPATLDALAARTGLTRRAARISADAMVALGLLEVQDGTYRNGTAAARFLSGPGPADLRPFLRFWDKISYPAWTRLAEALAGPAAALPEAVDLGPHQRLLDIGGGTGSWSIAIAQRHPHITGAVLELPTAVELARTRVAAAGLAQRITVITGDAMAGQLPTGYDAFLLANLVHYWSPEQNQDLLERVRQAAQPGSALLLADFWTNPAHTEPLQAALMAGEFATHIRTGDVYSVEEVRSWLDHTGWRFTDHRPLAGPQSLIVAQAA